MAPKNLPVVSDNHELQLVVDALRDRIFTPGDLKMAAYATPDPGWVLCDGTVYANSAFPELAKKLGTVWGGVAGTSFAVPDLRGRAPLGAGTGTAAGASAHALGQTPTTGAGGEETHLLTGAESGVQAHNTQGMSANDPHSHTFSPTNTYSFVGTGGVNTITAGTTLNAPTPVVGSTSIAHTHAVAAANAASAHNNLGPSAVVNFFIKT